MTRQDFLRAATALVAVVMIAGCDNGDPELDAIVKRDGQPPVVYIEEDDPVMTEAIGKARSTVDQIITALNSPKESQSMFSVKLLIEDDEHGEHIWILPVRYEDGKFYGTINNEPDNVTTINIGDEVDVAKDQISDWMYVENEKLIGGYTIRALRDSVPEAERDEFDRSVPFTIE